MTYIDMPYSCSLLWLSLFCLSLTAKDFQNMSRMIVSHFPNECVVRILFFDSIQTI